jgi:predicted dinucleotide-utilizing enzyme
MTSVSPPVRPVTNARIGLIGFGTIGSYVYGELTTRPELGLDIAFVHDAAPDRVREVPASLRLRDLSDFASRSPDLVVEMAHPSVTHDHAHNFLRTTDYMPLSVTALADAGLLDRLLATARDHATCLYVPHGAAVGLESIFECRDLWDEVSVVMKKNPRNLDFSDAPDWKDHPIEKETLLYDGSTRGVCPLFPRNVNSHAAIALAGIGFDRTRSVLIADPRLDVSVIEIEARGRGVDLKIQRSNPLKGVSGTFTLRSILSGILRAKAPRPAVPDSLLVPV